jgi:hypothetical protein
VRGIGGFQLRDRRPLSGAGTDDGVRNFLKVGRDQFEGCGAIQPSTCWVSGHQRLLRKHPARPVSRQPLRRTPWRHDVMTPLIMAISFSDSMQLTFAARDRLLQGEGRVAAFCHAMLVVGPACVLTHATEDPAIAVERATVLVGPPLQMGTHERGYDAAPSSGPCTSDRPRYRSARS